MKLVDISRSDFDKMEQFYALLLDDKSKDLFVNRFRFGISRNLPRLWEEMFDYNAIYSCSEAEVFFEKHDKSKVVIYGAGAVGRHTYRLLCNLGIKPKAFVDEKYESIREVYGVEVYSPLELKKTFGDYSVVVASQDFQQEMVEKLAAMGVTNQCLIPKRGKLFGVCGCQYFDLPELPHVEDEIFVDGGCYDLTSSLDFIKWCNGDFEKIYAFEPDEENRKKCIKVCEREKLSEKVDVIGSGVWSSDAELSFDPKGSGASRIIDSGNDKVNVRSIDSVLQGERCTFIKLDVEGAELEALKGMVNTVKKWHPKLAISIYHKANDFLEIPLFIMDNFEGYRFAIRHYSSDASETILYAY